LQANHPEIPNGVSALKYVWRAEVEKEDTVHLLVTAYSKNTDIVGERIMWRSGNWFAWDLQGSQKVQGVLYAILSSPNGAGVAYLLNEYNGSLGQKRIKKIWTQIENYKDKDSEMMRNVVVELEDVNRTMFCGAVVEYINQFVSFTYWLAPFVGM
jgi:hypothetical protein